jgi:hypothetical protein
MHRGCGLLRTAPSYGDERRSRDYPPPSRDGLYAFAHTLKRRRPSRGGLLVLPPQPALHGLPGAVTVVNTFTQDYLAAESESRRRAHVSARRCMPKRMSSVYTRPTIGACTETASRLSRGLLRRANQTPSNAPAPVATSMDDGCASRERMADRTCAKLSLDAHLACASRDSAAEISDRPVECFMPHPMEPVLLQAVAGWPGKADSGLWLRRKTWRSRPSGYSPTQSKSWRLSRSIRAKRPTMPVRP